jgi:uncharacterized phage infection (PIP) family protein YhgE
MQNVTTTEGGSKEVAQAIQDETQSEISASAPQETDETLDASDASEGETEGTDANSEESEDHRRKASGVQKKINKLTKRAADAKRETEYWKAEALKLSQKPGEQKPDLKTESASAKDGRPKSDDFETHEEYLEAVADWKYDQREKAREIKAKETEAKTSFQKSVESFQAKVKDFQKVQKDFEEVLENVDDIPMSMGVQEALLASDLGPQVMYELSKDREEYERINALNPIKAAYELGRIEARIAKSSNNEEPKKQTKAPAPIKPVGGMGGGGVKKNLSDPNLPFADYVAIRREQMKRRA